MSSDDREVACGRGGGWPRLAVSVCVWRGDEVLLVKRGKDPARGRWSPVGGMVEAGETLARAAAREIAEEAGIAVEIVGLWGLRELLLRDGDGRLTAHVVLAVHAARWLSGEPRAGDDAAEAVFVAADALADVDLVDGALPFILATRQLLADAGQAARPRGPIPVGEA